MAWDPGDLGSLLLWLDAESLGLSDGASVTTWTDLSANGHDYASAGNPPAYDTPSAAPNGLGAVLFDGTNDRLANGAAPGLVPSTTGQTIVVALQRDRAAATYEMLWGKDNSNGLWIADGEARFWVDGAETLSTASSIPVTTPLVLVVTRATGASGAALAFFVNGTAQGTGSVTSTSDQWGANLGAHTVSTGEPFQGPMWGLIVCEAALGSTDRQLAEGYMAWRYGFQTSLPLGHPWRDNDPSLTHVSVRPDADTTTTGWTATPLWSKIEESSADGTIVTATAA